MSVPPTPSPSPTNNGKGAKTASLVTVILAKGPQVVGLYLAIKEVARENVRDSVLLFCALLVAGAQAVQELVLGMVDRFLGDKERG